MSEDLSERCCIHGCTARGTMMVLLVCYAPLAVLQGRADAPAKLALVGVQFCPEHCDPGFGRRFFDKEGNRKRTGDAFRAMGREPPDFDRTEVEYVDKPCADPEKAAQMVMENLNLEPKEKN